jgi:2-keto-4-pentenoate hydratase
MADTCKLTAAEHHAWAQRIDVARQCGVGIAPPSDTVDFTFADAYRIRRAFVDRIIAAGARPRGHKIGFTSEAMQRMYGMSGPDFGILTDTMFVPADQPIRVSTRCNTRAEPELAFELARPLRGPGVTIADALAATARIWAAVEIIDSRVGALRAKANDSLADNAGAGYVVLGHLPVSPDDLDVSQLVLEMTVNGASQQAPACDVMGHPAVPLAWLANKLPELDGLGGSLEAGDIVISGSPMRSVAVAAGDILHATFGPLGTLTLTFD